MVAQKIDQCMKPHGKEGIKTIKEMNKNHEDISEFAFKCMNIKNTDKILDIGCGGGANIEKFLQITENNVDGLDYSDIAVCETIKKNKKAVDEKRCKVIQANVNNMPIEDESYDIVSAFETIYFWPDIKNTFKKILKIIKPNGKFIIAQGTDGNHPDDEKWLNTIEGMKLYTPQELENYLLDAGFGNIHIFKKENDYIIVVIASKD